MSKEEKDQDEPTDIFSELYRLGLLIFCDDAPDFPEIVSTWGKELGRHGFLKGTTMPNLPPHPHHWIFGALIMGASALGKVWFSLDSAMRASELFQSKV